MCKHVGFAFRVASSYDSGWCNCIHLFQQVFVQGILILEVISEQRRKKNSLSFNIWTFVREFWNAPPKPSSEVWSDDVLGEWKSLRDEGISIPLGDESMGTGSSYSEYLIWLSFSKILGTCDMCFSHYACNFTWPVGAGHGSFLGSFLLTLSYDVGNVKETDS